MRLLVAIPTMDTVPVPFMQSLVRLAQRLDAEGVNYEIAYETGTLIYMARDRLASVAVNGDYTHVLWLDSDMVFSDSILEDLQFSGKDFVSGIAHGRRSPFLSCLFKSISLSTLERWKIEDYPTNTFQVAGCGFACVLIKTEIIRAVMLNSKTAFTPFQSYGEDLSFCKRATDLGYKIYAEPTVRLGHVAHLTVYPEDAERFKNEIH